MRLLSVCFAFATAASVIASSDHALAQTVAPKQCVTVARDPDDAARTLAVRVEAAFATAPAARVVADTRTRAILRGEITDDATMSALVTARRTLTLADTDSAPLGAIADALGCASITVIASSPRGFVVRRFDVLARRYDESTENAQWTDDQLRTRLGLATSATTTSAATNANAAATAISTPANASSATATTSTTQTTGQGATTATGAPGPMQAPSSNAPRAAARPDPRVTTQPDPLRNNTANRSTPVWAWVIAGVAGAGLIGAFIAAQSIGPSVPLVRVSGPGMAP